MRLFYSLLSKINYLKHISRYSYETYRAQKYYKDRNVYIAPNVQITSSALEDNVKIFGPGRVYKSTIAKFSYVQYNSNIGYTSIGPFCSIGPNFISGMGFHYLDKLSTHPIFYEKQNLWNISFSENNNPPVHLNTSIGADTWIGANVFIKDGVNIGIGAVIGAGSVVVNDIPDFAIYAGIPAKLIKMRFDSDKINSILESKWWSKDISEINLYYSKFISD